ncbi:MAG: hypothetical protein GXX10_07470 [Clostridiaceae bacterium]|nr:hypothetical protein [Clostridiaceae bacterium]
MNNSNGIIKRAVGYAFPAAALILSLYAKETSYAARNALYLCLDVVIPSLFPFFVLSRITAPYLSGFSCPKFLKKLVEKYFGLPYYTLVSIILGYLSGYPTGAKLAHDMIDEGLLDSRQASKLIAVANNCSPLFLIGTIGAGLFHSIKIGFLLLLIHWSSGIIAAFFIGRMKVSDNAITAPRLSLKNKVSERKSLAWVFPAAVEEAAILSIKVTGYIVLFAVMAELLAKLGIFTLLGNLLGLLLSGVFQKDSSDFVSAVLRGVMEITSGSQAISGLKDYSLYLKLAAVSLICGFAGFSVHTQIMGIMKDIKANYRILFFGKLTHGIIAGLMTYMVLQIMPMSISTSETVALANSGVLLTRLLVISVLILSLIITPYRTPPLKKASKN